MSDKDENAAFLAWYSSLEFQPPISNASPAFKAGWRAANSAAEARLTALTAENEKLREMIERMS